MIIITHPERCIYKLEGYPALRNYKFYCDALSTDNPAWNEDPFIWSKYPLYTYCHSHQAWSQTSNRNIEKIANIDHLWIPKEEAGSPQKLLFVSPVISKNYQHKKQITVGQSKKMIDLENGSPYGKDFHIMIDTIITPLCLIELPCGKLSFESIVTRIEDVYRAAKSENIDSNVLQAIEYLLNEYDYIKTTHFPTTKDYTEYNSKVHCRKKHRTYIAIGDPHKSYFATEANDVFFDSKEQITPEHPIFNKRGVPFKEDTPINDEMLAGVMAKYHFESFYDAFFNKSIDFKELRSKLS